MLPGALLFHSSFRNRNFRGESPVFLTKNLPNTDWSEKPNCEAISLMSRSVHTSMRRALKVLETRNTALYRQMTEHFGREHPGKRMTSKAMLEQLAGLARGG